MTLCTNCHRLPPRPATGMCRKCYESAQATPIAERVHKIPDRGLGLAVTCDPVPVDELLRRAL